jgi:PAP2 superfamily
MWLPWNYAAVMAALLAAFVVLVRPGGRRSVEVVSAFAKEIAIVLTLYAIWQLAGHLSLVHVDGAIDRGRWIWDAERAWHLPSEATVQQHALAHPLVIQFANIYYAVAHVPALIAFLIWLFVFHRDRYPRIRNTLALLTGACLVIQFLPVAPPRFIPGIGIVDAPSLYHQSVYGPVGTGIAAQLSALPSVHVAWALLVGLGVLVVGRSRWRYLVLAHPLLTIWAVAATGNHYWADGILAAVLLAAAAASQRWHPVLAVRTRLPAPARATTPDDRQPEPV